MAERATDLAPDVRDRAICELRVCPVAFPFEDSYLKVATRPGSRRDRDAEPGDRSGIITEVGGFVAHCVLAAQLGFRDRQGEEL